MSLKILPVRVRVLVYLFWVGMVAAGIGVVGFFLSFGQVGSPAQAATDIHRTVPVIAYASILLWVAGLVTMWYCRRKIDAAVAARLKENCDAMFVDDAPAEGDK